MKLDESVIRVVVVSSGSKIGFLGYPADDVFLRDNSTLEDCRRVINELERLLNIAIEKEIKLRSRCPMDDPGPNHNKNNPVNG